MDQKRVHKRIEDLIEVEFVNQVSGVTTIMRTRTRDISAGGIKVFLTQQLVPSQNFTLTITLPDPRITIKAEAEVVSSDLIGVVGDSGKEQLFETRFRFADIDLENKNVIIEYVYRCRGKEKEAQRRQSFSTDGDDISTE